MAYEKHTWQTGEVITAEKLNNLEDGCGKSGGTFIVTFTPGSENPREGTSDKSVDEIIEALNAGKAVLGTIRQDGPETVYMDMYAPLSIVRNEGGTFMAAFTFTLTTLTDKDGNPITLTDTVQYITIMLAGNSYQTISKSVNVGTQD